MLYDLSRNLGKMKINGLTIYLGQVCHSALEPCIVVGGHLVGHIVVPRVVVVVVGVWGQLYKNRSSRKIDSQILFSREYDFTKTFSLTENPFSRKTYFYRFIPGPPTRAPYRVCGLGAASHCWASPQPAGVSGQELDL